MESVTISQEEFWKKVSETPHNEVNDRPIIISGFQLHENATTFQGEIFKNCNIAHQFALPFFKNPPKLVLDLGCGIGTNTLPMLKNGAHVTAIDRSETFLAIFRETINDPTLTENLNVISKNLVTMDSYGEEYNLVVAIDILPYIPPSSLFSTMKKIHNCLVEDGNFIGSIFTHGGGASFEKLFGRIGAHFYSNDSNFVEQFLTFSGFTAVKIEQTADSSFSFIAKKLEV